MFGRFFSFSRSLAVTYYTLNDWFGLEFGHGFYLRIVTDVNTDAA